MNNHVVAKMLLKALMRQNVGFTCIDDSDAIDKSQKDDKSCGGFLCNGSACNKSLKLTSTSALYSLFHILVVTVNEPEQVIIPALKQDPNWSNYLDRQQVCFSETSYDNLITYFSLKFSLQFSLK